MNKRPSTTILRLNFKRVCADPPWSEDERERVIPLSSPPPSPSLSHFDDDDDEDELNTHHVDNIIVIIRALRSATFLHNDVNNENDLVPTQQQQISISAVWASFCLASTRIALTADGMLRAHAERALEADTITDARSILLTLRAVFADKRARMTCQQKTGFEAASRAAIVAAVDAVSAIKNGQPVFLLSVIGLAQIHISLYADQEGDNENDKRLHRLSRAWTRSSVWLKTIDAFRAKRRGRPFVLTHPEDVIVPRRVFMSTRPSSSFQFVEPSMSTQLDTALFIWELRTAFFFERDSDQQESPAADTFFVPW